MRGEGDNDSTLRVFLELPKIAIFDQRAEIVQVRKGVAQELKVGVLSGSKIVKEW